MFQKKNYIFKFQFFYVVVCTTIGHKRIVYRGKFNSSIAHDSTNLALSSHFALQTMNSEEFGSIPGDRVPFIPIAFYKGQRVAVKKIDVGNLNLNRSLMLELKKMKDLQHEHLVRFYGACLEPPETCILTEFCPKGSLQDILENEQIKLDWMFKLSLMHDIVRVNYFTYKIINTKN